MPIEISYTNARANFGKIWDQVIGDNEVVIINRRGTEPVAMISAAELSSLNETVHLPRSPRNGKRLFRALDRADAGTIPPGKIEDLVKLVGNDG